MEKKKLSSRSCRVKRQASERQDLDERRCAQQQKRYELELASFKAKETPESVLLLDAGLWRFLIAWKHLCVSRQRQLSVLGKGEESVWPWLWENSSFSMEQFAVLSGTSIKEASDKLKMLSGHKMVYPDGTLNSYVERLLKARVLMLFKKTQSPQTQRSPKE